MDCPHRPTTLYELNTRVWLRELGAEGMGEVPDAALDALAARGIDTVWLMGVWAPSPWSTRVARGHAGLRAEYTRALPDAVDADIVSSPYAVADYTVASGLGGDAGLATLRARLRARGIGLLLDFVPNHTACDHGWLATHPEYYVAPSGDGGEDAFSTPAGARVFHGRDPYFPPWTDTAQLDFRRGSTRAAVTAALCAIAARCDGVRCDMAMLPLTDVFNRTWGHAGVAPIPDDDRAEGEFWPAAIDAVRRQVPGFVFMAEAYWGTEQRLQHLGFDWTYDKALYDALSTGSAEAVNGHLASGHGRQRRGVHFLENHDEDRAASRFAPDLHPLAALLAFTLPGVRLVHQGQLEGARRRLPVQLARRADEPLDGSVAGFYATLLGTLLDPVLQLGSWRLLSPREAWPGNVSHQAFVAYGWDGSLLPVSDGHRVLVVNLGLQRAQCRLRTALPGLGGRRIEVRELLGAGPTPVGDRLSRDGRPVYLRDGDALAAEGLFIELPGRTAQLLRLGD